MLTELSIKNYALIKEANINFKNNLNIITGETGSGKSILLGCVNICLGKRFNKDMMRNEDEETIASCLFTVDDNNLINKLKEMDIDVSDNQIIIYRKISKNKNISKINDIPVTLNKIKEVSELLLEVYGQHDSEDLRKNYKHLEFLDEYIGNIIYDKKNNIRKELSDLKKIKDEFSKYNIDESQRLREIDLLNYEIKELEEANLEVGEEEKLSNEYKKITNSKNILDSLYRAKDILQNNNLSTAVREIKSILKYDDSLNDIYKCITDCESLNRDLQNDIDNKINDYNIDEKQLYDIENRLNLIRKILMKYDNKIEKALNEYEIKKERLETLTDYDKNKKLINDKILEKEKYINSLCNELSDMRKKYAKEFEEKLIFELKDLGFLDVKFKIELNKKEYFTEDGFDECIFYISLNTGEKMMPLSEVASGGELSRIMLSIKTILSNNYGKETLIFDEIDQGISGITASKVAKKLKKISKNHQVICITHLPQIAAASDNHYLINKKVEDNRTITNIKELDMDGMIKEIGRLIGNDEVLTDKVLANAKELKENANKI